MRGTEKTICHDCHAKPGEFHQPGCDVERCMLCGGQLISCHCVYRVSGMDSDTLEEEHPDIYEKGATNAMWEKYDAEVKKYGGPDPWTGIWPGVEQCIEFGWYSRWVSRKTGQPIELHFGGETGEWQSCKADDEGAGADLNRLNAFSLIWSPEKRRWLLP